MRIHIVGGGPAGLYFGILMKRQDPAHEVIILERDGPDDTYGWGIVFSDRTLSSLRDHDRESHRSIRDAFQAWDNVDVVHRGVKVTVRGNRFSGIARVAFLQILRRRCEALGVEVRYRTPVDRPEPLRDCDLLVGADGANSLVRRTWAEAFQPSVETAHNHYIWLGTPRLFQGLTLSFRETPTGVLVAHSYRFSPNASTFIVECVRDAWDRTGFGTMGEEEQIARLEEIFADDLEGQPLLTNNFVKWQNFPIVRNRQWQHENVVLLGDALHTAHFSIGSGTKLALEDAIALSQSMAAEPEVRRALRRFQQVRKPVIDDYQDAALSSLVFFENADRNLHLDPIPFTYALMTRSEKIDRENLRRRDPEFVRLYERWTASRASP